MNKLLQAGIFLLVAAAAGLAGYYLNRSGFSAPAKDVAVGQLLQAQLADLDGKKQMLAQSRGKVLVVNFWATWCAPCKEEIPELNRIQDKYVKNGVQVVGIALDSAVKVRNFVDKLPINYTILIANGDILTINKDLGNPAGVVPFTLILDRSGRAVYSHAGALTEAALALALAPVL